MYSSSVSSKYTEPPLSSNGSSSPCVSLSEVASVDNVDGVIENMPLKNFQRKQQVVMKEHRIPMAKRMMYAASRKRATGRGTSAASVGTWVGMLEEIEDKVRASDVQGDVALSFLRAWSSGIFCIGLVKGQEI